MPIGYENNFLRERKKKGLEKTHAYVEFGLSQLERINPQISRWVSERNFAEPVPNAEYVKLEVSGTSEQSSPCPPYGPYDDSVSWSLWSEEATTSKYISDAILHTRGRYDLAQELNSGPDNFSHPLRYFSFSVNAGVRGWVKDGKFPRTVSVRSGLENEEGVLKHTKFPAYTDTRREATAGFTAARDWAKFRAMALASSGYFNARLKEEAKTLPHGLDWHDHNQRMRSRGETTAALFLDLLPVVNKSSGGDALKHYYVPGFLEAAFVLELQKGMRLNFGQPTPGEVREIGHTTANPIAIVATPGKEREYAATLSVCAPIHLPLEGGREIAQEYARMFLEKAGFQGEVVQGGVQVGFTIEGARKVGEQIKGGEEETTLHKKSRSLIKKLNELDQKMDRWRYDVEPPIKAGLEEALLAAARRHFS